MNVNLIVRIEAVDDEDESVQAKLTIPIESLLDDQSPASVVAKLFLENHYPEIEANLLKN